MGGKMLRSLLVLAALAPMAPTAGQACTFIYNQPPTPAQQERAFRDFLASAAAVIDGEVIEPEKDGRPATVRVDRVFKGFNVRTVRVGPAQTSCEEPLTHVGERRRLILMGGPDVYRVPSHPYSAELVDKVLMSADPGQRQ
jgi:hypothetical protein